jgi:hypothetical protein
MLKTPPMQDENVGGGSLRGRLAASQIGMMRLRGTPAHVESVKLVDD